MALPHTVAKVTLSGTCFGGQEIWSTGFYLGFEGSDALPITDAGVAAVANAWNTFFQDPDSYISNQYKFEQSKIAMIQINGKTIPDSAKYYSPPAEVKGGAGPSANPPQTALVATLANSLPRGLATKGRMFLPGVNPQVNATGHLDTFWIASIADNLKTFFDTLQNTIDLPGDPVLASVGRGAGQIDGAIRKINTVKVGNVYDTQRRRRNGLLEAYTARSLAAA